VRLKLLVYGIEIWRSAVHHTISEMVQDRTIVTMTD